MNMKEEDYQILTENNVKICLAEMVFINADRAAFGVESSKMLGKIARLNRIRFHKVEDYAEMYEGDIHQIKQGCVFVENLNNITAQLRSDLKMRVSYQSTVRSLEGPMQKNVEIQARDISCGGICFYSVHDLMTTPIYETVIPITKDPLILNLKIVRKTFDKERQQFVYGCRFLDVNYNQDRLLRQAIFRLQMIAKKKIKPKEKEV